MRVLLQVHGRPCIGGVPTLMFWRQGLQQFSEQMGKERANPQNNTNWETHRKHMTFKKRHIRSLDVEDTWMRADLLNLPSTHPAYVDRDFGPTWGPTAKNGDDKRSDGILKTLFNFLFAQLCTLVAIWKPTLENLSPHRCIQLWFLHFGPYPVCVYRFSPANPETVPQSCIWNLDLKVLFCSYSIFRIIFLQALLTKLDKKVNQYDFYSTNQPKVDTTSLFIIHDIYISHCHTEKAHRVDLGNEKDTETEWEKLVWGQGNNKWNYQKACLVSKKSARPRKPKALCVWPLVLKSIELIRTRPCATKYVKNLIKDPFLFSLGQLSACVRETDQRDHSTLNFKKIQKVWIAWKHWTACTSQETQRTNWSQLTPELKAKSRARQVVSSTMLASAGRSGDRTNR